MRTSLSEIIPSPARIPVRFYEALKATYDAREKLDVESPVSDGPSRLAMFEAEVNKLVEAREPMEYHEIEKRLKLVGRREFKRRARHMGEETLVPGSREVMWLEADRTGGPVANLPQSFTPCETKAVFGVILKAVAEVLAMARDDKSSHARTTALPLDNAHAEIEWLVPPSEDVLARLLLEVIGEDGLKEIFYE